ncbi:MAG: hypothetical protein MR821_12485, partial [Clostridiales bacterium]|nr:hypothetical protein [Clostridiales bacterium]
NREAMMGFGDEIPKQVWNCSLPPAVREAGRRRLETARSAFGATMRVSRVGSPTYPIDKAFLQSSQGAKRGLTVSS